MAAHRYWRVGYWSARNGGPLVSLSEFWLLAGTVRVDGSATLTLSTPVSGTSADLGDNNTSTEVVVRTTEKPVWDFGSSPQDITDIRLGSTDNSGEFPAGLRVQWSDDGATWTDGFEVLNIVYPGSRMLTTSPVYGYGWSRKLSYGDVVLSEGGLLASHIPTSSEVAIPSSLGKNAGRLQVEFVYEDTNLSGSIVGVGFGTQTDGVFPSLNIKASLYLNSGSKRIGNYSSSYGATWGLNDVIGATVDFADGSITFYKNGVSQGVAGSVPVLQTAYAMTQSLNTGPMYKTRLRTRDFQFPIAGAEPWEPVATRIAQEDFVAYFQSESRLDSQGYRAPFTGLRLDPSQYLRGDFRFDPRARGRIVGTVKEKNTPVNTPLARRVRLYRDRDGMLIAETFSTAAGDYEFLYLEENEAYTAIAYDHMHNHRAVAADNLTLENGGLVLMP